MFNKLFFFVSYIIFFTVSLAWAEPLNIIFLIGDGMGFEQVKAAGMYSNGAAGNLIFETFPNQAEISTYSANNSVTDSAAAATAIATGFKVDNGVISIDMTGTGSDLYTLLEYCRDSGKSTGLVSTTYITHATPAAFGAHENSRNNLNEIADDYLQQTQPNILLGGGDNGMTLSAAEAAGYTVVKDNVGMQTLDTNEVTKVSGQFGNSHMTYEYDYFIGSDTGYDSFPHLSEMTQFALDVLENDPEGFFLMVEGGRIDHAGHSNEIERNIFETLEFNDTVQIVYNWAQTNPDTLILVTADHETGGLTVLDNNGQGQFPEVSWTTTGHTGVNVPVYAWGKKADLVSGVLDNTNLFKVVTGLSLSKSGGGDGGGGCFIATAAYGSYWEPHVMTLRQFRDSYLLKNKLGTIFVETYYRYSPPMADYIAEHDSLRSIARIGLAPLVGFSLLAINFGIVTALTISFSLLTMIIGGTYFIVRTKESK